MLQQIEINISFIVHFCHGKYSFNLEVYLTLFVHRFIRSSGLMLIAMMKNVSTVVLTDLLQVPVMFRNILEILFFVGFFSLTTRGNISYWVITFIILWRIDIQRIIRNIKFPLVFTTHITFRPIYFPAFIRCIILSPKRKQLKSIQQIFF